MNSWIFFIGISMIFATAKSMPGGWKQVTNLNSPEIQNNGQKAAMLLGKSMNSPYHFKMMNVTQVDTQVVSGMNYKFKMSVGPSECKKSKNYSEEEIKSCPLQKCKNYLNCSLTMYVQPWTQTYKITNSTCEPVKSSC